MVTLVVQTPLIAILLVAVYYGCDPYSGPLMFCLAIAALWFGMFAAVRELVSEYGIYERERMLGLRIDTYIFSKIPLLWALASLQCVILVIIIYPTLALDGTLGMSGNLWRSVKMLWILCLTAAGGVSLGLVLSALSLLFGLATTSRTGVIASEVAMSFVPLALLPQVILGGPFYTYDEALGVTKALSKLTLSRWSLSALLSLEETGPRAFAKQLGMRGEGTLTSCGVIVILCLCMVTASVASMKYLELVAKRRGPAMQAGFRAGNK
jgi:hypothetical protein